MKLKTLIESFSHKDEIPQLSVDEKREIIQTISEYNKLGESLNRQGDLSQIAETLGRIAESAQSITLSENEDFFDGATIKENMNTLNKASANFTKMAKEAQILEHRMTAVYEDMGHVLQRYFQINEVVAEGNEFSDIGISDKELDNVDNSGESDRDYSDGVEDELGQMSGFDRHGHDDYNDLDNN